MVAGMLEAWELSRGRTADCMQTERLLFVKVIVKVGGKLRI